MARSAGPERYTGPVRTDAQDRGPPAPPTLQIPAHLKGRSLSSSLSEPVPPSIRVRSCPPLPLPQPSPPRSSSTPSATSPSPGSSPPPRSSGSTNPPARPSSTPRSSRASSARSASASCSRASGFRSLDRLPAWAAAEASKWTAELQAGLGSFSRTRVSEAGAEAALCRALEAKAARPGAELRVLEISFPQTQSFRDGWPAVARLQGT